MHLGSSESGHYYSWIHDDPKESTKWYEFNDEMVTEISSEEIQQMCESQDGVGIERYGLWLDSIDSLSNDLSTI